MRELKKTICIFIAVIMMIPVFSVSAHDFTYDEMAAMLNSMEILHGDGTGYNFYGMLTRAQFTKLAVTASVYKNSVPAATNTSPYADVKRDHWAAGYIKTATVNSLITGYPDSTFKPENNVKTEEAATILLKMMGYTNEDFGNEWPYGQMGIASNIGLMDNVSSVMGGYMKRIDAIAMIYNMITLNTKQGSPYINTLGYRLAEDAVIIASCEQDSTIDSDKVYTTEGYLKFKSGFIKESVGRCGDILIKTANSEIAGFFPRTQGVVSYTVDSVKGEDVWVSDGGAAKMLGAQSNTTVYEKTAKSTLSGMLSKLGKGDKLTVVTNEAGNISYMVAELAENKPTADAAETYVISAILGSDIIVSDNGQNVTLDVSSSTTAYYDSKQMTYGSLAQTASVGDIVSVVKDANGKVRYVYIDNNKLEGPYTVNSAASFSSLGIRDDATILKSGIKASASDVKANDIVYYSSSLNTVWVYSEKKTGIYESASPNMESPSSITLSGVSYKIESSAAYTKLAANGSFGYGSTVTLLLGRNGEIADVISPVSADSVIGYMLSAGISTYKNASGNEYSSYYAKIASPDGTLYEYTTDRDYTSMRSKVVKVTFGDSGAKLTSLNESSKLSGTFDMTGLKLGSAPISPNIKIIEVKKTDVTRDGEYLRIYGARIDGLKISAGQVLYSARNASGEIDELILSDITGDLYSYGIVEKNNVNSGGEAIINGASTRFGSGYTIKSRTPAKFDKAAGGSMYSIEQLSVLSSKPASVNETAVTCENGDKFPLSDTVSIYYENSDYDYIMLPLSDIIGTSKYALSAYYDKPKAEGGRIRIIIARNK